MPKKTKIVWKFEKQDDEPVRKRPAWAGDEHDQSQPLEVIYRPVEEKLSAVELWLGNDKEEKE